MIGCGGYSGSTNHEFHRDRHLSGNEISNTFVNMEELMNYCRASLRNQRRHMSAMATRNVTIRSPPSDVRGLLAMNYLHPYHAPRDSSSFDRKALKSARPIPSSQIWLIFFVYLVFQSTKIFFNPSEFLKFALLNAVRTGATGSLEQTDHCYGLCVS